MSKLITFKQCKFLLENEEPFRKAVLSWADCSYEELIEYSSREFMRRLVIRTLAYGANPDGQTPPRKLGENCYWVRVQ
jgi:hypothetical protein